MKSKKWNDAYWRSGNLHIADIDFLKKIVADKSRLTFMEFLDHVHLNILL